MGRGLDIEDFIIYMPKGTLRLLPGGLHTGSNHWNAQWQRFFDTNPTASRNEILQHLKEMLDQLPPVRSR